MTDKKKKRIKKNLLLDIRSNKIVINHLSGEISKVLKKAIELEETRTQLKEENEKKKVEIQRLENEKDIRIISEIYTDRFGTIRGKCQGKEVQWNWAVSLFHFSNSGDYIFNYKIS